MRFPPMRFPVILRDPATARRACTAGQILLLLMKAQGAHPRAILAHSLTLCTELRLTRLRNAILPPLSISSAHCSTHDEGLQRFEYGIYLHDGEAEESNIVKEAAFNCRPTYVPESAIYCFGSELQT